MTNFQVGDKVTANVMEADGLVGEVTRIYTEAGLDMVEVTFDEDVFDDQNTLDVEASSIFRV